MPISAEQWRAVTGLNNTRRPRQVGIKRYMQQEPADNVDLSHFSQPDAKQQTARRRTRRKKSQIMKGSLKKDRHSRPERNKIKDDIAVSTRSIVYLSVLVLCVAVIIPTLSMTTWQIRERPSVFCTTPPTPQGNNSSCTVISDFMDARSNSTIPVMFESSSVMGVQLLQSFISVVVMLLLLLSGDIETNPGPTVPELTLTVLTKELQTLSKPLNFGIQLNVPQHQLDIIKTDHPQDTEGQKTALFEYISQNHRVHKITWTTIAEGLEGITYGDLALSIRERYCQPEPEQDVNTPASDSPASDSTSTIDQSVSGGCSLATYGEHLKQEYLKLSDPQGSSEQPTKMCRLAMIKNERTCYQADDETDEFVRQKMKGKISDILHTKTPIELKDILKDVPDSRKVILVEGAPGAGKSSLSLDICQKWSNGELFQEYQVAVLVRLRDPKIQKATTIAGLLPFLDELRARQVEDAIKDVEGRSILWVLDGWDEFPDSLKNEQSLIRNMICLPNHKSAVVVTSRPASSVKLHSVVSNRIEILGFTPEELNEYFMNRLGSDSQSAETLIEKIKQHPEVESSCYLPLHASFILDTFRMMKQAFPTTQYGIFESVVSQCISRHQKKQCKEGLQSLDEIPAHLKSSFEAVCELAYKGILENKVIFTESDLPQGFNSLDLLQEVESMLAFEKEPSKTYNFLHLSIEEFLAAHHLATKKPYEQVWLFRGLMQDERCLPMLTFYAAKTKLSALGITDFFSSVSKNVLNAVDAKDQYNALVTLLFAFRCICEAESPTICEPLVKTLNGKMFSCFRGRFPMTLLDYYSIGSFLALSSTTDVGGEIKVDIPELSDQECTMLMKGMLKCMKDTTNIVSPLSLKFRHLSISLSGANDMAKVFRETKLIKTFKAFIDTLELDTAAYFKLFEGMKHSTALHSLHLGLLQSSWNTRRQLTDHQALEQMLQNNTSLQVLTLQGGVSGMLHNISQGLQRNNSLKQLELCAHPDSLNHYRSSPLSRDFSHFSKSLIENKSLQVLKISFCDMDDCDIINIARALQGNCSLQTLELSINSITLEGVKVLSEALRVNKSLQCLKLTPGRFRSSTTDVLSTNAASHFFQGIKKTDLKELDLSDCGITCKSFEKLSRSLMGNRTLEVLKLSYNNISDKVASHIAIALARNNTLREVQLRGCDISAKGTGLLMKVLFTGTEKHPKKSLPDELGEGLVINSFQRVTTNISEASKDTRHSTCPLKELSVTFTASEGAKTLGDLITVELSLESLNISSEHTDIYWEYRHKPNVMFYIIKSLKVNSSLKFLHLERSVILTEDELQLLCEVLSKNKTLITVYVDCHSARYGGPNPNIRACLQNLAINTTLQELRLPTMFFQLYDVNRKELEDRINMTRRAGRTGQMVEIKVLKL